MTRQEWFELVQLAEAICPAVLMDLPVLLETDARGILCWLRLKASRET